MRQPERPLLTLNDNEELFTTRKSQVEYSRSKLLAGKFSLLTKFLHGLGLGLDMTAHWDKG